GRAGPPAAKMGRGTRLPGRSQRLDPDDDRPPGGETVLRHPSRHWLATIVLAVVLTSCASAPQASPPSSPSSSAVPTATPGPGGLTLDEEVGAVIMAGFEGPLTDTVLADWKLHQFGGLLVVNLNHNAGTAASMTSLI